MNLLKTALENARLGGSTPINTVPDYVPSGTTAPPITTTTAATDTTPDISKLNIKTADTTDKGIELFWDNVPDATAYMLSVKVGGKYVALQEVSGLCVDVVCGRNGYYYVSDGGSYNIYKYSSENGKFDKVGTLKANKIGSVVKANNVTLDLMIRYKRNGRLSEEKDSYKISVKVYYKPAVVLSTGRNESTGKSYIKLRWEKVDGAEAYRVCRYVNGRLRTVADLDADRSSQKISGTKSGKTYTYAVKALVNGKWTKVYPEDLASIESE